MKMLTLVTLLVAASVVTAQTETAAPAAAPSEVKTEVAAPAKTEMKKAKKVKKAAKPKAEMKATPVTPMPPAVTAAPMAAPAMTTVVAPATTVAVPAANTTAVKATEVAAPTKKWSASISVNPSVDFNTPKEVGTLTKVGGGYKLTDKIKASLGHTFQSVAAESVQGSSRDYIDRNNFRSAYTDLGVSTSVGGILKSDDISIAANARIYSTDALVTREGAGAAVQSLYDINITMPYTITPKISAAMFTQIRHSQFSGTDMDRIILSPSVSYAFNDVVSIYQSVGYMLATQDELQFRKRRERATLETGVDIAPMKGLSINLNVNQDKAISTNVGGEAVSGFNLYKPNDGTNGAFADGSNAFDYVSYEAVVAYSF
jgi:hypothetical protein